MTEKTDTYSLSDACGLYLVGEIAGIRVDHVPTQTVPMERHTLGLRVDEPDSYGGSSSQLVEVRLSRDAVASGLPLTLDGARGVTVSIPVWVQAWTGKRGAGSSLMLDTKRKILGL